MSGECGRGSQPQASDLGVCCHQHSAGKGEEKQKYRAEKKKKSLWFISELVGLRSSRRKKESGGSWSPCSQAVTPFAECSV